MSSIILFLTAIIKLPKIFISIITDIISEFKIKKQNKCIEATKC